MRNFVEAGGRYADWVKDGCTPMRVSYTSFCRDTCEAAEASSDALALCGYECARWELGGAMGSAFNPETLAAAYVTRRALQERLVGGASGRMCVPWASRCGAFCAAACFAASEGSLATCGYECSRWELGAPSSVFVAQTLRSAAVQSAMDSGDLMRIVERVDCGVE